MLRKLNRGKVLILITLLIQAVTIIAFLLYISYIDQKYFNLIDREVKNMRTIQQWTSASNNNFIRLMELLDNPGEAHSDSLAGQWQKSNYLISPYLDTIRQRSQLAVDSNLFYRELLSSRKQYILLVNHFLTLSGKQGKDSTTFFFLSKVKPAFIEFQSNLRRFTAFYTENINDYSETVSSRIKKTSGVFVLFGFSPYLIGGLIILSYIVILSILLGMFRNVDLD